MDALPPQPQSFAATDPATESQANLAAESTGTAAEATGTPAVCAASVTLPAIHAGPSGVCTCHQLPSSLRQPK